MCSPLNHYKRRGAIVRAAIVVGLLCLLTACEIEAPQAHELFWHRVVFTDLRLGRTYETLTIFVRASDANGMKDLDALFVINDNAQLFWRLQPRDWLVEQTPEGTWIGSTALAMPEQEMLPSGVYRTIIQDISGETAELDFEITSSTEPAALWKSEAIKVTIEENELAVTGPFISYEVWMYGSYGSRVSATAFKERIDLQSTLPNNARKEEFLLYVYAAALNEAAGHLSGPYSWHYE